MKNTLVLLMLILGWSASNAQDRTDNPTLPRIYEEGGYPIEKIVEFAKDNTEFSKNYRTKLLLIINNGLIQSGEYVNVNDGQPLDEGWIDWIYYRVIRIEHDTLPAGSSNTWRNGNQVAPTRTKQVYFGPIDRFVFGNCVIKLDKPSCANLLGYTSIRMVAPKITKTKPIIYDYVNDQTDARMNWSYQQPKQPKLNLVNTKTIRTKTWFGRNAWWVVPVGTLTTGALVGGGIYLYNQNHTHTSSAIIHDTNEPGSVPPTTGFSFGIKFP